MNVASVMTPRDEVVTASLPGSRDDVLEYLQEHPFSSVPVIKEEDGREVYRGLVSRDALIEWPDEDQLALLMEDVPTTTREADLEAVASLMVEENARRVPVVDGELEGIVTVTDVIRAIASGDVSADGDVEAHATDAVNTVYAETPLTVAEREISFAREPYAVVLDEDGDMCGVLTEVDVLDVARVVEGEEDVGESIADEDDEWMWEGIKSVGSRYMPTREVKIPNGPVREFMSPDVVSVTGRKSVRDAAQLMISNDIEQLPLVSGEALVGVVRDVDLLEAVHE